MPELQLPVLDCIRDRHEHNEKDQRLRQSKETCGKEGHKDARARHRVEHNAEKHHRHRAEKEPAAAELLRQRREERDGEQPDDDVDDAEERELLRVAEHIDKVIEVEIIDDILPKNKNKIRNRHPEQLIILDEDREHVLERGLRLVLTQRRVLFLRPKAEDNRAECCDAAADDRKRKPPRRVARAAVLVQREIEHDGHDDRRDQLTAEHRADTRVGRRHLALTRVERERRDHRPDGNILCRVKNIHNEIEQCEEDEVEHRIRYRQPAHIREENRQRDRRDERAHDDPRLELAPTRLRLVNRIADKGIKKEFTDAQYKNDRRYNSDHIGIVLVIVGVEQIARDKDHEVCTEHSIEHIMSEGAAGIRDARPELALFVRHGKPSSAFDRADVGNDAVRNLRERCAPRIHNEIIVCAVAPLAPRIVVIVARAFLVLAIHLLERLALVDRTSALLAVVVVRTDENGKYIIALPERIVRTASEENARTIIGKFPHNVRLRHEHPLTGLAHRHAERVERNEARGQRLHRVLKLEQFLLVQIVDAELCRREMDDLAIVEMNPQLLGENVREFPSAAAIPTADGEDKFLLLHVTPSFIMGNG